MLWEVVFIIYFPRLYLDCMTIHSYNSQYLESVTISNKISLYAFKSYYKRKNQFLIVRICLRLLH